NSGKSPDQPMATLTAMLAAYTFKPGDIIYVDNGAYTLIHNIVIGPQESGVRIQGPSSGHALFNRGNANEGSYVVELQQTVNVTVDRLLVTGGYYGVFASSDSHSIGVTISGNTVFGNAQAGIFLDDGNDGALVLGNIVHHNPTGIRASFY